MITLKDLYNVASAVVPLYLTMFVAYASVKWGKVFTPEQCAGINRFVAIFAVPLLSFEFISRINPYRLNDLFIAADVASKVIVLLVLLLCSKICRRGTLDLSITVFSLATLPNTLVMGIPLLKSMYGDDQEGLMIQVVVLQSIIWYTLLLFLFEYRAARIAVMQDSRQSNSESEVVSVVVAKPSSPETSQPRPQNSNKVAPDEEHGEGPCDHTKKQEEDKIAVLMILRMVWSKLIRNPNTYASLLGLGWALTSNRWNVKKPLIMDNSVTILSNAGLGMAMFSLGLFMALQPRIIACGKKMAACAMAMKFLVGPAVMALASVAVGLRGTTLKVSIVQAALPQGIVPFVFAREYNLHPDVLSTAVIFGMIVSLPVTILFYVFLGL